jgi:hypothetical protein
MTTQYYANGFHLDILFIKATETEPADTNNPSHFKVEVPVDTNDTNDTNTETKDLSEIYAALQTGDIPGPQISLFSGGAINTNNSLSNFYKSDSNYIALTYNPFSACTDQSLEYIYFIINDDWTFTPQQTYGGVTLILVGAGGGGGSGLGYTGGGAGGEVTTISNFTFEQNAQYLTNIGKGGAGGKYQSGNFYGNPGSNGGDTVFTQVGGGGSTFFTARGGGGGGGSGQGQTGQGGTNIQSTNDPNNDGYGGTYGTTVTNTSGTGSGYGHDGVAVTFPTEGILSNGTSYNQTVTFKFAPGGGAGGRNSSGSPGLQFPGGGGVGVFGQQTQYGCDENTTFSYDTGGNGGRGSYGISTFNGNFYTFDGNNYNVGSGGGGGGNSSARHYSKGGTGGNGVLIAVVPIPSSSSTSGGISGGGGIVIDV